MSPLPPTPNRLISARYRRFPSSLNDKPWLVAPATSVKMTLGNAGSLMSMAVIWPPTSDVDQYVLPSGEKLPSWPSRLAGMDSSSELTEFSSRGVLQSLMS